MPLLRIILGSLGLVALLATACSNPFQTEVTDASADREIAALEKSPWPPSLTSPPSPLVTVNVGTASLDFWPFTSDDFSDDPQDPINLIFFGKADPLEIRAALLSLDGNRGVFPAVPPFNSLWEDAIGDVQVGYGEACGWTGGVVQLACGEYQPARFHLRLFKMGIWTVGNAHFEILIPNTTDHQVISWEVAEQFLLYDFQRSGLLDPLLPLIPTAQINPSPFRVIPAIIYNGLPIELRVLIGGPLEDVTEDVPIGSDGHAVIVNLAEKSPCIPGEWTQDFVIDFDQVIPKPFCSSGPLDYLYVNGPVHLIQTTHLTRAGQYQFNFYASGNLTATPVDPFTGEPTGEPIPAFVREQHFGLLGHNHFRAASLKYQSLGEPFEEGTQTLFVRLQVGSACSNAFQEVIRCGSGQ